MKDSKKIRKVLFLGKSDIALVALTNDDGQNNILFAEQVAIDFANLKVKINELLTNAANFLGFNIKDVEIVFDDCEITRYGFTNQEFVDCNCEEDIAKEIFKKAKIDNYFVNEINFYGINYDEIDKVARVNCQICASNYITYKKYIQAVKACNLIINNSTNLYKLLKANKEDVELAIKIENNKAIACEYYGNKLNNVKVIDLKLQDIYQHLADKFNINVKKIPDVINVANNIIGNNEKNIVIANNYDLKTKTYNHVQLNDFVTLYRDEIRTQINNFVDYRDFRNIRVISSQAINAIDGFDFVTNEEACFDTIALDKLVCLANLDLNKEELNQFGFESKIKTINLLS
ncbi:MAG: hypothetical protein MJ233_03935 [Mycoplasmoidaceae bacterium]|nr:hypothetical protein [Mycoplasmoidaceae bacterium]